MSFDNFNVTFIVLVANTILPQQTPKEILLKLKKETGNPVKLSTGKCVTCKRNRSPIV